MNIIDEKLDRLDQAILNNATPAELRGYIVDIRDHLAAQHERDFTTELEILRSEYSTLALEHEALKTQLQNGPEIQHQILRLLSSNTDEPTTEDIAGQLFINELLADFHVKELSKEGLIACHDPDMSPGWFLTHEGKRYLADRNIL